VRGGLRNAGSWRGSSALSAGLRCSQPRLSSLRECCSRPTAGFAHTGLETMASLFHKEQRPQQIRASIGTGMLPIKILPEINSHLDTLSLLHLHDVCRFWRHCIPGTSSSLRAAIFLPTTDNQTPWQPTTCTIKLNFRVQIHVKTGYPDHPKDY
jgi:hypothetical protein